MAGADRLALSAHIAFDDLLALARFVLFPKDDLTLAALLKSPLCSLDDASLYDLAIRRGKTPLWTVIEQRRDERPEWREAYELLTFAMAEGRSRRPVDFYGRVLARLDAQGRTIPLIGRGYSVNDAFYEANGGYSFIMTCNEWTGRALRAAGVRMGLWTPVEQSVMWRLP